MLSIEEIKEVKKTQDNLDWGVIGKYYNDRKSDCDYKIKCGLLCNLLKAVMHGYLIGFMH
jgi:hypothetical protein